MRDAVVVFARAPRLGAVKRRLAHDIGDRAALRFHVATLTRLVRALAADRRFRTVLAVTPDHARFRLPVQVERLPQGHGDLGMRMQRAFQRFPNGRVAIIGCDIPDAGPQDALAAFRALGCAQAAFGPAADGGYWLVAMSPRSPRPSVRVGALVHRARAGRHVGELRRPADRSPAHAARRGHRCGLAQVASRETALAITARRGRIASPSRRETLSCQHYGLECCCSRG